LVGTWQPCFSHHAMYEGSGVPNLYLLPETVSTIPPSCTSTIEDVWIWYPSSKSGWS